MRVRAKATAAVWITLLFGASTLAGASAGPPEVPLYLVDSAFGGALTRVFAVDPDTGVLSPRADLGSAWTPVLGMAAADARVLYLAATDNSGADRCEGLRSCVLVRVTLSDDPAAPAEVVDLGTIRTPDGVVGELVGLTFGPDGLLYASSQATSALYVIDAGTAAAREVGPFGLSLDGGDLTFDDRGRLLLWNNLGDQAGLYDVDPATGTATVFELHPGLGLSGMAAPGHSARILGASPPGDLLYEIDPDLGLKRAGAPLTLDGSRFDHKRGDLDSPYCSADPACEDGDLCTDDSCTPGGCRAEAVDPDDGKDCTVDSCDPDTGPVHVDLRLVDSDGDAVDDCADACPESPENHPVTPEGCAVDQLCPCEEAWPNHGAYVSCVSWAVERTGEGGRRVSQAARSNCGREGARPPRPSNPLRGRRGSTE